MPDTTNLLDADEQALIQWTWGSIRRGVLVNKAYTALRDEIVRQAREGMVPEAVLHDTRRMKENAQTVAREQFERSNALEAENARLRDQLIAAHAQLRGLGVMPKPPLGFAPDPAAGSRSWYDAELARLRAELETAKRDGAREALTRLAGSAEVADYGEVVRWRDREYPAPAVADTGEREDAARLDALQSLLIGADFAYGPDADDSVVILRIPRGVRIGADLRAFADAARAANQEEGG